MTGLHSGTKTPAPQGQVHFVWDLEFRHILNWGRGFKTRLWHSGEEITADLPVVTCYLGDNEGKSHLQGQGEKFTINGRDCRY